jgi:putative ABC transport system permease protein
MLRRLIHGWRRLAASARADQIEQDLDDELRFHLAMEEEQLRKIGAVPAEARRAAVHAFGPLDTLKDELRHRRRAIWLEDFVSDLRFAARTLASSPAYAALVVLTLGLGIGANSAIFSVINGVLLKPLANADGEHLVVLRQKQQRQGGTSLLGFSPLDLADFRDQLRTVDAVVEFHNMTFNLIGQGEPEEVRAGVVDSRFFDVMGVTPILGRGFTEEEDRIGRDAVMVLSDGYWHRRFGGDPSIVGKTFQMNGRVHTVVGVLPRFTLPIDSDIYVPTSQCPVRSSASVKSNRSARMMTAFARLKPEAGLTELQNESALVASRLAGRYPEAYPAELGHTATARMLKEALIANARSTLVMLLGAVGFVLLVSCANVANLTLARLSRREKELAIRSGLGAGRGRLLRQLLTESTLLAVIGGALGLVLAYVGIDLLRAYAGQFTPRASEVRIDITVLAFTAGISLITGIVFGAGAALTVRHRVFGVLREVARASSSLRTRRLRSGLVVGQLALAFILLSGAGLLVRSFIILRDVDTGVVAQNVLALRVVMPMESYQKVGEQKKRWLPILERVNQQPEVMSSAAASLAPLRGGNLSGASDARENLPSAGFEIEGRPTTPGARPRAQFRHVTPAYFRTVGIPLLRGRVFAETDSTDQPRVCVINQTFARTQFGRSEPLGARLIPCDPQARCRPDAALEIVGVVGDVRDAGLETEPAAEIYAAAYQSGFFGEHLLVRSTGDPFQLARRIVGFVHDVDPNLPVEDIQTLETIRRNSLAPRRLTTALLTIFAAIALVVTTAGIVGVTAFSVSQRRHEIGVRMALGADRARVLRLIAGESLCFVIVGLAVGFAGTLAFGSLMRGLVWGITPTDPTTLLAVSVLFLIVAALASVLPARRATLVDPVIALRTNV